jgi:hypothetical protein
MNDHRWQLHAPPPLSVFFIAAPTDKAAVLDLQRGLKAVAPELTIQYWDGTSLGPTEWRPAAKAFLETARLAVIVHSGETENWPDLRYAIDTAFDQKAHRPDQFDIAVIRNTFWQIPANWAGVTVMPDAETTLEGAKSTRHLIRTAQALATWLLQPVPPPRPRYEAKLPLTLPDLQERLLERTDRYNLSDVFGLLKQIVQAPDLVRSILQCEDEFTGLYARERLQAEAVAGFSEYARRAGIIRERLVQLIGELQHESLLRDGWRPVFLAGYHRSQARLAPPLVLPMEEIGVPETLNLPVTTQDTGSAERVGLLSYEQKLEFRRLLILAQDAMAVGKFAAAFDFCEQVRTQIDPESAQLYEYLLVAYLKKEGVNTIMRRQMEGIPSGFRFIKLFSDRFQQYQSAGICPSGTGQHNCAVAVEEAAAALHEAYSQVEHSAILDTGLRWTKAHEHGKIQVRQCLEAVFLLNQSLAPTKVFTEAMLLELVGGGKYNWMARMVVQEGSFVLLGNEDFDLVGKVEELMQLLRIADLRRSPEKQREMLREDLFWHLLNECHLLARQVEEEQRIHHERTDLRRSLIRVIEACIAGHLLFTREGDQLEAEKSLLRLAIELLLPELTAATTRYELPSVLYANWFTLDNNGEVQNDLTCKTLDFDALTVLSAIAGLHDAVWPTILQNIKKSIWMRYGTATDTLHESVKTGLSFTDFRRMNELEARSKLVQCMLQWRACYRAYPEAGQDFLQKIMRELVGNELLIWLNINPLAVNNHPDNATVSFDAVAEIIHIQPLATGWTSERVAERTVYNLYQRVLLPLYNNAVTGNEKDRNTVAHVLGSLLLAFQKHRSSTFLRLVYRELTLEEKFKWTEIGPRGELLNFSTDFGAVQALAELNQLFPDEFPVLATHQQLADNRWQELHRRYEREISGIRHENRLPERKMVADIIWRSKGIFLFFPDYKYLDIAQMELSDQGRIRWFERLGGILATNKDHFENVLVPFDLKAERAELQLYRDQAGRLFQDKLADLGIIKDRTV